RAGPPRKTVRRTPVLRSPSVASQPDTTDLDVQDVTTRSGLSLLQIAWQRKSLVVLGIMLGMVLGLLYYAQRQPIYQAQSSILIVKKSPDNPLGGGMADGRVTLMEDYMGTQTVLIRSPEIVERALRLPMMQNLQSFPGETGPELVGAIRGSMNAA